MYEKKIEAIRNIKLKHFQKGLLNALIDNRWCMSNKIKCMQMICQNFEQLWMMSQQLCNFMLSITGYTGEIWHNPN